jgi:hypothetical protein
MGQMCNARLSIGQLQDDLNDGKANDHRSGFQRLERQKDQSKSAVRLKQSGRRHDAENGT